MNTIEVLPPAVSALSERERESVREVMALAEELAMQGDTASAVVLT